MENFNGKIAVITGGGTGMGRELTYQLAAEGCHVSICDVIEENMEETFQEASKKYPHVKITKHLCDVSSEEDVLRFRDEVWNNKKLSISIYFLIMPVLVVVQVLFFLE